MAGLGGWRTVGGEVRCLSGRAGRAGQGEGEGRASGLCAQGDKCLVEHWAGVGRGQGGDGHRPA